MFPAKLQKFSVVLGMIAALATASVLTGCGSDKMGAKEKLQQMEVSIYNSHFNATQWLKTPSGQASGGVLFDSEGDNAIGGRCDKSGQGGDGDATVNVYDVNNQKVIQLSCPTTGEGACLDLDTAKTKANYGKNGPCLEESLVKIGS